MKYAMIILSIAIIGLLFLVGCAQQSNNEGAGTLEAGKENSGSGNDVTRGIQDEIQFLDDGTPYLLHPSNILSGGPPKDGIPSIDDPDFESVSDADSWISDDDLVLGLNYNGAVRAYPLGILNWHEIVNDEVDGERILITYCPLCRTGIAFKPLVDNEEVEFGTSGKLYNSELIMYDRKTDSYWTQTLGKAILGEATGQVLDKVPLDTVQWKDWKTTHPDSEVLSRQTGFIRDYDRTPYGDYDTSRRTFFPTDNEDDRLHPKEIVFGVDLKGASKAYTESDVEVARVINDEVGGTPIVVVWDSQLNTVKIFERTVDGEAVEFSQDGDVFTDSDGNSWTVDDMTKQLEVVDTFGHFWFAWVAFFPETELYIP